MEKVTIYPSAKIIGLENIQFGANIIIDDYVFIYAKEKMFIGNYVHIACFSSVNGNCEIVMSDFSTLSHGCRLFTASDDFKDWGFGNSTIALEFRNLKKGAIHMGKFSILGANTVVLPGVTIGEGVSVAANSVVTKDLAPWGIYKDNRRIEERNRDGIMKNYEKFICSQTHIFK